MDFVLEKIVGMCCLFVSLFVCERLGSHVSCSLRKLGKMS